MSEYLKSLELNDAQYCIKSSLSQRESVYVIHIPWLLKSGRNISTSLPSAMSQNILSKHQVCTQRNQ